MYTQIRQRQNTILLFSLFFFFLSMLPAMAQSNEDIDILNRTSKAFSAVVKKANPAVVNVMVEKTVGAKGYSPDDFFNNPFFERFFGPQFRQQVPQRKYKQQGQGTGFIISPEGYILTNNHVVEDADDITVTLDDRRKLKATLIGSDPQSDVALIKIEADENFPTLPLGDSDALEVGEWVIAIGNPFGLNQTVTIGVVSAKGRSGVGLNEYENFIQTDAAINPGNSGGPLLNIHGEVVGINSALFSRTGGYMGIGFAIPINMVKAIENQLQKHGKVTRGWLGVAIQDVDENLAQSFGLEEAKGILVSEVTEGSPAEEAGLKQGDVIVKLNGKTLESVNELRNRIALIVPKTDAEFEIIREGKARNITVVIGEQPEDFSRLGQGGKSSVIEDFGLSFQELTQELADQLGYTNEQGVLIGDVEPGSVAAKPGSRQANLCRRLTSSASPA